MTALKNSIRDLLRYPSAILGSVIIIFLLAIYNSIQRGSPSLAGGGGCLVSKPKVCRSSLV
jgi:hypothetical protein